jgi:paraquat-inducible protein B
VKTKASPAVVGAFVIGALALGLGALLSFSSFTLFAHPERFVVYFDESIHGLDLGSPVKLSGVRVGRVVDLNVRYDAKTGDSVVAVICELNKNKIRDAQGDPFDVTVPGRLQLLVDRGLRAQLGVVGLATGLLFVELDFLDPKVHPPEALAPVSPYTVIPSVPSTTSEFQASAEAILSKLRRVDFEGLSNNLKALLADARGQVDGLDLKGAVTQWKSTGASLQALVQNVDLKRTVDNLDTTLTDLRQTLAKVGTQVDANGQNLQATLTHVQDTLSEFSATAATVRHFVAAQQNLGDDANQALAKLGDAAESVQRLTDFLERNPNALLAGKKPAPAP